MNFNNVCITTDSIFRFEIVIAPRKVAEAMKIYMHSL